MKLILLAVLVIFAACTTNDADPPEATGAEYDDLMIAELLDQGHSIRCTFENDGRMYGVHPQTFEVWYDEHTIIVSYETRPEAPLTQIYDTTLRYPIEHSIMLAGHEGEELAARLSLMEEAGCDYIDMASDAMLVHDDYDKAVRDIEYYARGGDYYLLVSKRNVRFGDITETYDLDELQCEVRDAITIEGRTCDREEIEAIYSTMD